MSTCPHGHTAPSSAGYCETCGAVLNPSWVLIVTADHKYHEFVSNTGVADIPFPRFCPERRFALHPGQSLVGRRSVSRDISPGIDLTGPPEDPGIGHAHAVLIGQPDGTWRLVDLDSVNGTYLNYGTDPIEPRVAVPVGDGDLIHVGAWTTLTLRSAG